MTKDEVASALDEIGTLLALKGENDFRTRAYTTAARLISQLDGDLNKMVADGTLATVRGVGDAIVQKVGELLRTGRLKYLDDLRASVPPGLVELLRVPGLGPKKAKALYDELGVDSLAKLQAACEAGAVAGLKGFGDKTQAKLLDGVRYLGSVADRVRIDQALPLGLVLLERVKGLPGVVRAELCGSLRRRRETAKDIDIVASAADPPAVVAAFTRLPEVRQVAGQGPTKASVVAALTLGDKTINLAADLRVVADDQFPFAVLHFSGSKAHNIRLRQRAIDRGLLLNDYGLANETKSVEAKTEADIYKALDLHYIPPEMREDTGEVERAERQAAPELVEPGDIRGVFHNHTTASDGGATLAEMAAAAKALGYEYFGVGDHSQSLTVANGLTPDRVRAQWAEIDALNARSKGFRIFKGTECDILPDGSLDFPDDLLAGFDYVVVSVHTHFGLGEAEQTDRVCKALSHPAATMLGHATGRLLLRREGYKIDLERVIRTAAEHGKMIEINAQPSRLDLDWTWVKRAKASGVMIVINPDAHSPEELALVPFGVNVARRGWLTAADVFNTRPLAEVARELDRRKAAWLR